jgi:hypothetical protein
MRRVDTNRAVKRMRALRLSWRRRLFGAASSATVIMARGSSLARHVRTLEFQ